MDQNRLYRRKLPHIRSPGAAYHVRFSVHATLGKLTQSWMFEVTEQAISFGHKRHHLLFGYVIMENHAHIVLQPLR